MNFWFNVTYLNTTININRDGSIDIYYYIQFFNHNSLSEPIWVFDIGFPNVYYDLDSVRAKINGTEISEINKSPVVEIGVEILLGSHTVPEGYTGILEVWCHNPIMVFKDSEMGKASTVFLQTWFD